MIQSLPRGTAPFEIQQIDGTWVPIYGCSIAGIFQFQERIDALQSMMQMEAEKDDGGRGIREMYMEEQLFCHHCCEALRLNQLDPERIGIEQLQSLLFFRISDDGLRPGLLAEVNDWAAILSQLSIDSPTDGNSDSEPIPPEALATPGGFAGLLASGEGTSYEESLRLVSDPPAMFVVQAMAVKHKIASQRAQKVRQDAEAVKAGTKGVSPKSPEFKAWQKQMKQRQKANKEGQNGGPKVNA